MSLLFVDSQMTSEVRTRSLLEEYGYTDIQFARTIQQADTNINQSIADNRPPRLIVLDSTLDDGDGYEYCRQLKNRKELDDSEIIQLVSSLANRSAIEKALRMGADNVSVKPYEGKEFIKHLLLFSHRKSVLVVEDDPLVLQILVKILRQLHLVTISSKDGMDAYNLINRIGPPKLVVMDIGLPGMNGVKLVEHIRKKSLWDKTPVIMLTGSSDSNNVKASLSAGANDYVIKPVQPEEFGNRVRRILENG